MFVGNFGLSPQPGASLAMMHCIIRGGGHIMEPGQRRDRLGPVIAGRGDTPGPAGEASLDALGRRRSLCAARAVPLGLGVSALGLVVLLSWALIRAPSHLDPEAPATDASAPCVATYCAMDETPLDSGRPEPLDRE